MNEIILNKEIQYVKGVGPTRAKIFEKLGIKTVYDLLYYFPRDWVDRTNLKPINKVLIGQKETVKGTVIAKETKRIRYNFSITSVLIRDERGYIYGVWYNQPYMEKIFKYGDEVIFHGKVELYRGSFQMNTPEYEIIKTQGKEVNEEDDLINVNRIVPIYSLTEKITQKQIRKIIKYALDNYLKSIEEYMPPQIMEKYNLIDLNKAIYNIHFPENLEILEKSKFRLKFDEFFFLQFAYAINKKRIKEKKGKIFNTDGEYIKKFFSILPFKLTNAQIRVINEIKNDLISGKPMNRLLQGDVGSGKTIVAVATAIYAKDSGMQTAIMAPTEILATQHFNNISNYLKETGIKVELLLGGTKKKQRENILTDLKSGLIDIIIGTHSLIQEDVQFNNLGLVVIDEQHRFGVMQRADLISKGENPHCLIMTATPIPRTLSLTVYGDTDVSVIDEMPPGRKPIKTILFENKDIFKIYSFIEERLKEGSQVYAIYPLVEESEKIDLKSAINMEKQWAQRFKDYNVAIVHGQMPKEQRDKVMLDFKQKKIHILVATTVIEVGIDIPNASVIVIEHAERFGLSQLHQLRGRVGRGEKQSYCILIGDPKTEDSYKRLEIMVRTQNGFEIAEEDLSIRGPGEFMGIKQHGMPEFKLANIIRDRNILELSKEAAFSIVEKKCDLNHIQKVKLYNIIKLKYKEKFNLINVS